MQYSPIFKSHCYALGKQLKIEGHEIKYLLSSQYKWMLNQEESENVLFAGKSKDLKSILFDSVKISNFSIINKFIEKDRPKFVYFQNIHPIFNYHIIKRVKKYGGTVIQHIHEPYVENKSIYGGSLRYWLYIFEFIQGLILNNVDKAILSSQEASILFNKRYPEFNGKKIMIPLIYEDLGLKRKKYRRQYINFIGPPVPAKGPEKFLDIVRHSDIDDKFLLISRLKIEDKKYYQYRNLKIFYEDKINDEIIGNFMDKSLMTITPYKTARQSSVTSTANMYGTPVLGTNINGLKEFIYHKKTGYLVDIDAGIKEWLKGVEYIKNNLDELSANSRNFFEQNHSETNWPKYFKEVFEIEP